MEENKREKKTEGKRGLWKAEEDLILKNYVETHGEGNWAKVSKLLGLKRGGKSCRLRWKNYLRPNIKRGAMSKEEEDLIIRMHNLLGNRWSLIAGRLPGRTDNEVKNYWNTHLNKKTSVLGKRKGKAIDESNHQSIPNHQNNTNTNIAIENQGGEEPIAPPPAELPMISSPKTTTDDEGSMGLLKVDGLTDNTWMERAVRWFDYDYDNNYEIETPLMMMNKNLNYAHMVFDEEPFTPCLDSFVLFEAFGTDSDLGKTQSFLP
ncbi:hypothetical protein E1A91_D08G288500v1 [Gossypium mustelinum]|uniref:Transcription factor MYB82 n=1 Tax=Gossypium mustelinum TaxID=34275 RepID=A0A5D2U428_GOSMU|nr:hypothetical protein E1A91_D08G288500v1 [Gossypium mustelinum]